MNPEKEDGAQPITEEMPGGFQPEALVSKASFPYLPVPCNRKQLQSVAVYKTRSDPLSFHSSFPAPISSSSGLRVHSTLGAKWRPL
jgi:hypothetical protein